jgi:branched-chain amino acid aminotransferase
MLSLDSSTAFMRDSFVPFQDANLSIASSPVLYGLSVYTVFSANWNKQQKKLYLFRLEDHYRRLLDSAKIMDFHSFVDAWSYERFNATMLELLRRNKIQEDALIRVSIFVDALVAGTRMHDLPNNLSAYVYPIGEILPRAGIHACVSSWQRTPDNAIPSRAKINGSYGNASLMKNEALLNGYDEAIAIDSHGHVSEGTVANLFIVRDGVLITPDTATDILEGITRNSILRIADDLGIGHQQRSVDRSELYIADEAFMCGSSARITPILSIDKRSVGKGKIGPLTTRLMKEYEAVQRGTHSGYGDWLTLVPGS